MRMTGTMNGKTLTGAIMVSLMLAASCAAGAQDVGAAGKSESLELVVRPGEKWKSNPQFAAWIATDDGAFVKPIAVSAKAGKRKWIGNPEGGRLRRGERRRSYPGKGVSRPARGKREFRLQ